MEKGLCGCGCGMETNLASMTDTKRRIVKGMPNKFIVGHASRVRCKGGNNPSWKGGRYVNDAGYIMVSHHNHKRVQKNGYVREHILIAEKVLGKELPERAQVHHYGPVGDNSKLVICEDQEYHYLLHIRQKAFDACGDANKRRCKFCGEYDRPEMMHCRHTGGKNGGWNVYHYECSREYDNSRYARALRGRKA